jgi:Condensation domain
VLFHHLIVEEGDAYLTSTLLAFNGRERLAGFVTAVQAVVGRHDILRTAVVWEGLSEPAQVVWRHAVVPVEEVVLDPAAGDAAEQLWARYNMRCCRIDVRHAPLLRVFIAHDGVKGCWLLLLLHHHLIMDHTSLEVLIREVQAHVEGRTDQLEVPVPFRNFVAQARLGVSAAEHEAFFKEMLAGLDEPVAPFGLLDVQGDGSDLEGAQLVLAPDLARRLRERARALGVTQQACSTWHGVWWWRGRRV